MVNRNVDSYIMIILFQRDDSQSGTLIQNAGTCLEYFEYCSVLNGFVFSVCTGECPEAILIPISRDHQSGHRSYDISFNITFPSVFPFLFVFYFFIAANLFVAVCD